MWECHTTFKHIDDLGIVAGALLGGPHHGGESGRRLQTHQWKDRTHQVPWCNVVAFCTTEYRKEVV